jgi:hypothetical protein
MYMYIYVCIYIYIYIGIDIRHEGVGSDGGCGWPYITNLKDPMHRGFRRRYIINNNQAGQTFQRYRVLLHQVRHPLAVIRTLLVRAPR